MNPRVIAGERPLLAFVSSVMRPEVQWARDAAVEALTKNPTLVPWAFEYTPASSGAADVSYLAKRKGGRLLRRLACRRHHYASCAG